MFYGILRGDGRVRDVRFGGIVRSGGDLSVPGDGAVCPKRGKSLAYLGDRPYDTPVKAAVTACGRRDLSRVGYRRPFLFAFVNIVEDQPKDRRRQPRGQ